MRVLVSDKLDPAALERVRAAGHEVVERTGVKGSELVSALDGYHALMIRSATQVTAEVLRGARGLKVVVRAGTGLDNVDVAAARDLGIAVLNTPAANSVSVAELTLGLLIAFERHLPEAASELRAGRWEKTRFAGRELSGRRLGIVGFGRIGRELALRAQAFELEVWASDPLLAAWPPGFEWVRPVTLEALLPECDIVSLHLPLTPETRNLIGARELERMRKDALLVNCARGGLVDEEALLQALEGGALRGAILDSFAVEPPGEHPLLKLPNVLATPHLGASTAEAQRRAGDEAASLLIEALQKLAT
ncbi:MAG TPA: hydroxyacid dehydrogenase [Candidatus Eisenbacteria bacterium]